MKYNIVQGPHGTKFVEWHIKAIGYACSIEKLIEKSIAAPETAAKLKASEALNAEMLNTCERLLGIVRSIKDDDEYTKEVKHRAALVIAKAKKA